MGTGFPGREPLLDAIKGALLTLALFLAYTSFPVIGLLPGCLAPLPGIYYYLKRGAAIGSAVMLITLLVLSVMGDHTATLLYILQSGLMSILLPMFYIRGKNLAKAIACTVAIIFLVIALVAIGYGVWTGTDLQAYILKGIETSIDQAISVYEKQGLKGDELQMVTQGMKQAGAFMGRVFPALMLVGLAAIASLNMMALFRIAEKLLPQLPEPDSFHNFKNPEILVWVVIAAGFSMLLPYPAASRVALNLLIVTGFTYFLQGLAVILSFFRKVSVPGLARIIFWLFLAFQPYMALAIAILGIFDIWGDFRTPREKNL